MPAIQRIKADKGVTVGETAQIQARNDSLVQLALKKIGQLCCRHDFMLLQHRGRLAVRCRYCLRESKGFVVGEMPETVRRSE